MLNTQSRQYFAPALVGVLLLISLCSLPASACQCTETVTLDEELERADVIFAGRAIAVQSGIPGNAAFEVLQVWRGPIRRIAMTSNLWDCMSVFRVGEEYLIFAHEIRDPETIAKLGYQFVPRRCGQTTRFESSQEALSVLGAGSPPPEEAAPQSVNSKLLLKLSAIVFAILTVLAGVVTMRKLRRSGN